MTSLFSDYIDGVRHFLENPESDKEVLILKDIKIHFLGFIKYLIASFPLGKRRTLIRKALRRHLFNLFAGWSGRFILIMAATSRPNTRSTTDHWMVGQARRIHCCQLGSCQPIVIF